MSADFKIMLALDLETGTDRLLAEAQRYATALGAVVDVVHVAPPDPDFVDYLKSPGDQLDAGRSSAARHLRAEHQEVQSIGAGLRDRGVKVDQCLTVQGSMPAALLDEARKLGADLLIIGSHHHSALHRLWYADTVTEVAKATPCALLVVPL